MAERLFYLDYTLQLTERSRADLEGFWKWYRSDNALMGPLVEHVVAQRVFVCRAGATNSFLERMEVRGFEGISQYFLDLNAAKGRVPNPAARLDEFYRWVEISEFRVRGTGAAFERVEPGDHKVYVTETYQYRHAARARSDDFWAALRSIDARQKEGIDGLRAIQNYTEVIGVHWEFSRWLAFDNVQAASQYLDRVNLQAPGPEAADLVGEIYEWATPVASSIIEEVPNV